MRRRAMAWAASIGLHAAVLVPFVWGSFAPEVVHVPDASPTLPVGLVTWSPPAPPAPLALPAPPPSAARPRPNETHAAPPTPSEPKPARQLEPEPEPKVTPQPERAAEPALAESVTPARPTPLESSSAPNASDAAAPSPPSNMPAEPRAVATADEIALYVSRVRGLIDDRKHYPRQAQRRGVEGTVLMRLLLTSSGRVGEIDVVEAAHGLLEKATREAVDRVDDFPVPPAGVSWIEVAVRYDLDD